MLPQTEEIGIVAQEDMDAFRQKVEKKKRRRAVPKGSTPIELTQLLLLPNYRINRRSDALADNVERIIYKTDKTASDEEQEGVVEKTRTTAIKNFLKRQQMIKSATKTKKIKNDCEQIEHKELL